MCPLNAAVEFIKQKHYRIGLERKHVLRVTADFTLWFCQLQVYISDEMLSFLRVHRRIFANRENRKVQNSLCTQTLKSTIDNIGNEQTKIYDENL